MLRERAKGTRGKRRESQARVSGRLFAGKVGAFRDKFDEILHQKSSELHVVRGGAWTLDSDALFRFVVVVELDRYYSTLT